MSGFMQLQVWAEPSAETSDGQGPMPLDEASIYCNDRAAHTVNVSKERVWWGRYSAPGYMDRTETCGPFTSAAEAARETFALFGDDEPGSDDRRELARILWQIRGAK